MRKKTILRLYLFALLSSGVATIIFLLTFLPRTPAMAMYLNPYQSVALVLTPVLFVGASVLGTIAWIGMLVKQARQEQWGWFICTLLFSGIAFLIYLIAVPENSPQVPAPGYGQVYPPQPPMYAPPNPPSYPSFPNNPRP